MRTLSKNIFWAIMTLLLIAFIFSLFYTEQKPAAVLSIDQLVSKINNGEVAKIVVSGNDLKIELKDGSRAISKKEAEAGLSETLKNYGVESAALQKVSLEIKEESGFRFWMSVLIPSLLPLLIIGAFFWLMLRQARTGMSQAFTFGKANVKLFTQFKDRITFKDVAGLKEAKEELIEVVDFLKNPKKYLEIGARIPRGVLLLGPPGCGKTYIARAVAGEANVPFFHISGSEFIEMFVGVGSARVRDLFQTAKKAAPCITGDTLITLSDGQEIPIQEIFDKKMVGVEVPSINNNLEIENAKIIGIIKRPPKEVYELKTYHSSIKATDNHLFPRIKNGQIEWVELKNLKKGDRIAAPRKIKTSNRIVSILELLPPETRIYLKNNQYKEKIRKDGRGWRLCPIRLKDWKNPNFEEINKIAIGHGGWGDSWLFKMPQFLNEDVLYLKGLIDSDGHLPKRSHSTINFINTEINLHQKLREILKENFGYEPKIYLNKKHYETILPQGKKPEKLKDCYTTNINNKIIRIILKKIDEIILTLPENLIASWLSGVFDGDGYIANKSNTPKIVIVATNPNLNYKIKAGLHRLGIIGYSTQSNKGSSIEITGKINIGIFKNKIFSFHPDKAMKLKEIKLDGKSFWRIDQIPVGYLLKRARVSCGMGQRQFINGHEVSCWERNIFIPARENLIKRFGEIENWLSISNLQKTAEIKQLEKLIKGEVFWSKITSIKKLPKKEVVYDISLDKNFNFLANRLFIHNCLVFIDEIDAIGRERGAGLGGGHDEREQTLNQILVEMDGFERDTKVIVIAATNRPDILDPALLRPGRFDRRIVLDMPDINDREEILKIHSREKKLAKDVDLRKVAERTPGFSGADLANLMNEAALLAARKNQKEITQQDIFDSIEKVLLGPERRSRVLSAKEKEITAYHEAGHALVAASLKNADPVHKVSIVARGRTGGYTLKLPTEETYLRTKSQFMTDLTVLLGGYASEQIIFNDISTGAANDLQNASDLARKLVTKFGMSEKIGPITYGKTEELIFLGREITTEKNYSEKMAAEIDKEVKNFIDKALNTAKKIIVSRKKVLQAIAQKLIEKETLEREEFENLIKSFKLKPISA